MAERFVNVEARTSLFAAITAGATSLQIIPNAFSPPTPQFRLKIDQEYLLVTAVSGGSNETYAVTRGIEGTTAAAHELGAIVRYVATAGAFGSVSDPVAATPGLRTLGTGATQAAAGNDARFLGTSSIPQFAGLGIGVAGASGEVRLASTTLLSWNQDTYLVRDGAADALAMRRTGANPQTFRLYNTYTDASNWERGGLTWNANRLILLTEKAGTGTARSLYFGVNGGVNWFIDAASGAALTPEVDNTTALGSASKRVGTGYFGTSLYVGVVAGAHVRLAVDAGLAYVLASGTTDGLALNVGAANRWTVNTGGHFVPYVSGTYDIGNITGSPSLVRYGYFGSVGAGITVAPSARFHAKGADGEFLGLFLGATAGIRIQMNATTAYVDAVDETGVTAYRPMILTFQTLSFAVNGTNVAEINGTDFGFASAMRLNWSGDVYLQRDGAATLAMRNGANPQALRVYNSYTDASNRNFMFLTCDGINGILGTFAQGSAAAMPLYIQTGGASRWLWTTAGHFWPASNNSYDIGDLTHGVRTGYFGTQIAVGDPTNALGALYLGSSIPFVAAVMSLADSSSAGTSADLNFRRARGTQSALGAVTNGDVVGVIRFQPYATAQYFEGAVLRAVVDGTFTTSPPVRLEFYPFVADSGPAIALTLSASLHVGFGKALVALGGGAAPTLGTIGGSGPTTAAQNAWLEVKDSGGATMWIPVWK